jgi:hypothetical protein
MITSKNGRRRQRLKTKHTMNAILAFADPAVATSGAIVIVILSVMALIRSKMPS